MLRKLFVFSFLLSTSCQSVSQPAPVPSIPSQPASTFAENAWLEIDRAAFEANIRTLRAQLGEKGAKICAVLKADAYGHGISLLTPSILRTKTRCAAITSNGEAHTLREGGFTGQLIRIRTATAEEIEAGLPLDIEESIGNRVLAETVSVLARKHGKIVRIHLALNSGGMSRDGLELSTARGKKEALEIARLPSLEVVGIMTHFPIEDRAEVLGALRLFVDESAWVIANAKLDRKKIALHAANSFATLEVPESRLDMVRPGGLLFGDTVPSHTEYKRVMQFKSRVASINPYPAGRAVSYDSTYRLERESRLANVPVGYSNGYRRCFSNKAFVLIRGRKHPVLGRVTMNTLVVDVTDDPDVEAGDEVVLFGKQGEAEITQAELEKAAETILPDLYTVWGSSNPRIPKN